MPLVQTRGAASAQGFGEFAQAAAVPVYIEDVFSTWLYTGTSANLTITNGIDLSTKGGLVWIKERTAGLNLGHFLFDSARGLSNRISTNNVNSQTDNPTAVNAFNANGFSMGSSALTNYSSTTYASWTFAEQSKFFDAVTWTGNGTNRTIAHNLGSIPGCIIVKRTDDSSDWTVYHRSLGNTQYMIVNDTAQKVTSSTRWNDTTPTSTVFSLGTDANVNASAGTYVAYLWAHDAGGFGLTGTDNVVSCGTVTTDGSGTATVNLGYEPQWIFFKQSNGSTNWTLLDTMRGWNIGQYTDSSLYANTTAYEADGEFGTPTATGFNLAGQNASADIIYIAIRRGPMKVPTSGTSVFSPNAYTGGTAGTSFNLGFVPDTLLTMRRNTSNFDILQARLIGQNYLFTNTTDAETGGQSGIPAWDANTGTTKLTTATSVTGWNASSSTYVNEAFARAPSFFDVVCYTGTGANRTVAHNLTVVPELMIVKVRTGSAGESWTVWNKTIAALNAANFLWLNSTSNVITDSGRFNSTAPTSSVFTVGNDGATNGSTWTYVAYLFATCAGVSKVGSYTGNGSSQTINCGFTGGARFVLIRRTDSTGDWMISDSARGIVSGSDPYLELNNTNAEVTGEDWLDTDSTGFVVNEVSGSNANTSSATYIFLAIA